LGFWAKMRCRVAVGPAANTTQPANNTLSLRFTKASLGGNRSKE
jgi:hypothetical protein